MKKLFDFVKKYRLAFLIVLAVVARFLFLGLRPFDGDEGIIIKIAQSSNFKAMIANVVNDVHPPLFHALEYIVLHIFRLSEFSARFLPAICGILAIWPIYLVIKKLSDQKVAFWVSLLSIFSSVLAYHSAEVRPYALFTLIFFWQFYLFLQIQEKRSLFVCFSFLVSCFFLILTQYIGLFVLAGELLYLVCANRKACTLKNISAGLIAVLLFVSFWGKTFLHQLSGRSFEQSQAIDLEANLIGIFNAIYRFGAGRLFLDLDLSIQKNLEFARVQPLQFTIFTLSLIVPLILLIWGIIAVFKNNRKAFWLNVLTVLPIFVAALVSNEIGPRSARYLSFLAPFYLFFVAYPFFKSKNSIFYILYSIFLVIFLSAFINSLYFERTKSGVNKIAEYLSANAAPEDYILVQGGFGGGEELVLHYYLANGAQNKKIFDLYGDYQVGNLATIKSRDPLEYIARLKKESPAVWFYDLTYSFDKNSLIGYKYSEIDLGQDKEEKNLIVYKVE